MFFRISVCFTLDFVERGVSFEGLGLMVWAIDLASREQGEGAFVLSRLLIYVIHVVVARVEVALLKLEPRIGWLSILRAECSLRPEVLRWLWVISRGVRV